jgi:hypothetical protein
MLIRNFTEDLRYIADKLNLDGTGTATTKFVAMLNTLPLSTRQHILALAAALTAGVSNA